MFKSEIEKTIANLRMILNELEMKQLSAKTPEERIKWTVAYQDVCRAYSVIREWNSLI